MKRAPGACLVGFEPPPSHEHKKRKNMGRNRHKWDEYQDQYLRYFFPERPTKEIAEALRLSYGTVATRARQLGLRKTKAYRHDAGIRSRRNYFKKLKTDKEAYAATIALHKKFLLCSKKDSELTEDELAKKRSGIEKRKKTLLDRKRRDLVRIQAGLDPIWNYQGTRFKTKEGEKRRSVKLRLRSKYGYVLGDGRTVFYTEKTRRSKVEHLYETRYGIKFSPIDSFRNSGDIKLPPQWGDHQGGLNAY